MRRRGRGHVGHPQRTARDWASHGLDGDRERERGRARVSEGERDKDRDTDGQPYTDTASPA